MNAEFNIITTIQSCVRDVAILFCVIGCACLGPSNAVGQQGDQARDSADRVLATVNQFEITERSVRRYLGRLLDAKRLPPNAITKLIPTGVEQLVQRQIILAYLETTLHTADKAEVDLAIKELKARLSEVDKTFESHLAERKMRLKELRNEFAWKISWRRYLKHTLTDDNLKVFYDRNRRHHDGTRIKVAHVLFKIGSSTADDVQQKTELASMLRTQITSGQKSWANAVSEYSEAASSKESNGLVGWIERLKPMPQEFSDAAYRLDPGQISPPTATKIGIHLIKCLEVEPGKLGPMDVRPQLEAAATKFLFDKLAGDHRDKASIQFGAAQ